MRRVLIVLSVTSALLMLSVPGSAQAPTQTQGVADVGSFKVRFGLEYWVRASWRGNFDFDEAKDDGLLFGWQRFKPLFSVQNSWLELTAQGQDSRSHGVPVLNPNGSATAVSSTTTAAASRPRWRWARTSSSHGP